MLAEKGTRGMSLRAVAARLGGSVTLVTHYYPSRDALLEEMASYAAARWTDELAKFEADVTDPTERLRTLLVYLLPTTPARLTEELAYHHLLASSEESDAVRKALTSFDSQVRALYRDHLRPLVPERDLGRRVDHIRVAIIGVVIAAIHYGWTPQRQHQLIDDLVDAVLRPDFRSW